MVVSPVWNTVGPGDFNGDGLTDLLYQQRYTGDVAVLINGVGFEEVANPGPLWEAIQGNADFNGDGKTDVLFQDTANGAVGMWYMNGNSILSNPLVGGPNGSPGTAWHVTGANSGEIFFANPSTGHAGVWHINGSTVLSYKDLGLSGSAEQYVNHNIVVPSDGGTGSETTGTNGATGIGTALGVIGGVISLGVSVATENPYGIAAAAATLGGAFATGIGDGTIGIGPQSVTTAPDTPGFGPGPNGSANNGNGSAGPL